MANQEQSFYRGRLASDGDGNLLADEGEYQGYPVAYHEGNFVFVQPGELSHNQRHHKNYVQPNPTVDTSMTDDASLVNADESTNAHHFGIQSDDLHYEEGATDSQGRVTNTRIQNIPDAIAPRATGHTDAYVGD